MRISDWSSDVCSSDLLQSLRPRVLPIEAPGHDEIVHLGPSFLSTTVESAPAGAGTEPLPALRHLVGLAALKAYSPDRSEEHTSELQSLMRISYAVFCLKKKKNNRNKQRARVAEDY